MSIVAPLCATYCVFLAVYFEYCVSPTPMCAPGAVLPRMAQGVILLRFAWWHPPHHQGPGWVSSPSYHAPPCETLFEVHLQTTTSYFLFCTFYNLVHRLGLDGGACVLRLMCEVNADPVEGGGLIGDIFNLVFRYYSHFCILLPSHFSRGNVTAESHGSLQTEDFTFARNLARTRSCWRLHRNCPVSLFNLSFFTKP